MNLKPNFLIFSFFVFIGFRLYSQDIHFSQYYASPLTLNAANTGNFDGNFRLSNIYRSQWAAIGKPFRTLSIGFDKSFPINNDAVGAGIVIVNDRSGDARFTNNKIYLSASLKKQAGNHQIFIGIQPGFSSKTLSTVNTTLPDQWVMSSGSFENSALTQETALTNGQSSFFDLNAGFAWRTKLAKSEPQFGVGLFHITQPQESFFNNGNKLPLRGSINFNIKYLLTPPYFIYPHFQYLAHSGASSLVVGSNVGKILEKNELGIKTAHLGLASRAGFGRNLDAMIVIAGMTIKNIDIGISYDVNVSALKTATKNRGAFEISLIYIHPSTLLEKITTPCDRM